MVVRKLLLMLACLAITLPVAGVAFADDQPTAEDMASYQKEAQAYGPELENMITGLAEPPTRTDLKIFEKNFSVTKKSSSITRAFRRAKEALNAEVKNWTNSIASQGYVPVDNPKPIANYDYKWGTSGFMKFYVRLKLYAKVWCQKMQ